MAISGIRGVSATYVPPVAQGDAPASSIPTADQPVRSAQLPYPSPVLQYNSDAAVAVLLFRNGSNGDVETQYPSKQVVREYQLRGRGSDVADGSASGSEQQGGNQLLNLARGNISAISGSPAPGFGVVGVAASAGGNGGSTAGSVNFVA